MYLLIESNFTLPMLIISALLVAVTILVAAFVLHRYVSNDLNQNGTDDTLAETRS